MAMAGPGQTPEHILKLRQALGERLRTVRQAVPLKQRELATATFCTRDVITRLESGQRQKDRRFWELADRVCGANGVLLASFEALEVAQRDHEAELQHAETERARTRARDLQLQDLARPRAHPRGGIATIDDVRRNLDSALSDSALSHATLEDWEQNVLRHAHASRDQTAATLLGDLLADLGELEELFTACRAASSRRRLTRVAAQMSGLVVLTLCKLDRQADFQRWAKTARRAAVEAEDPIVHAWVLAQEAYGWYYADDSDSAIRVAKRAQGVAPTRPCVGAALAAALEARAQARLGRADETRAALQAAEEILAGLGGLERLPSALGYNEASLRFHAGNALTHLGDTSVAYQVQDQALRLITPGDYTDRAFTELDRAICLAHDRDATGAATQAMTTLLSLSEAQRQGIIALRAREVADALPNAAQAPPAVRELRDMLKLPNRPEG